MERKIGFYERYVKRFLDILCACLAIFFFWWLFLLIAIIVRIRMGKPVLFRQMRPGRMDRHGKEQIFALYKFRSMTEERDEKGELLPDVVRLGRFGKMLRATSLDEIPEVFNILKGEMSVVGPRPQLVKDLVFMDEATRMRHTARPGLTGLAQVRGRNAIVWEERLQWDLRYIEKVTFLNDLRIILETVKKVFIRSNITETNKELEVSIDYGDWLLATGKITQEEYDSGIRLAQAMMQEWNEKKPG